jgi:hypothetical protein
VKWPGTFNGLMSTAACLLPLLAAADSHIDSQAPNGTTRATAHVDFKIVIPQVLFLQAAGAERVAIMSNSRNVSLSAGVRGADAEVRPRGNVILSAAAGKVIAQDAECARFVRGTASANSSAVICTASMP